jgi:hypothetical protein
VKFSDTLKRHPELLDTLIDYLSPLLRDVPTLTAAVAARKFALHTGIIAWARDVEAKAREEGGDN